MTYDCGGKFSLSSSDPGPSSNLVFILENILPSVALSDPTEFLYCEELLVISVRGQAPSPQTVRPVGDVHCDGTDGDTSQRN